MQSLEELQSENEKLKKTLEVKSDLISISAHQLRTSLSALKWVLGMFNDHDTGNMSPQQKNLIDKALGSSEHMIFLVNTLLTLNHSDTVTLELHPVSTDMGKLLQDVLDEFVGFARIMNISLSKPDQKNPIPKIQCDPELVRIVLSGLIENAIKYSSEHGSITCIIEENKETNMVEISVHNDGTSIRPDEQTKIFGKFFRSADVIEKKISGSGLGLYIAKQIVERHNGNIWFESSSTGGTTFYVTLPIT